MRIGLVGLRYSAERLVDALQDTLRSDAMPQVGDEVDVVLARPAHIQDRKARLVPDITEELFQTAALARRDDFLDSVLAAPALQDRRGVLRRA